MTREENKAPRINRTPTKSTRSIKSTVEKRLISWAAHKSHGSSRDTAFKGQEAPFILGGLLLLYHPFSCEYLLAQVTTVNYWFTELDFDGIISLVFGTLPGVNKYLLICPHEKFRTPSGWPWNHNLPASPFQMLELNLWTQLLYASTIDCITVPNCQLTFNMVPESKPNNQPTNEPTNQQL